MGKITQGISLFLIMAGLMAGAWSIAAPKLFPGAVEQGLISGTMPAGVAFFLTAAIISTTVLMDRWLE